MSGKMSGEKNKQAEGRKHGPGKNTNRRKDKEKKG